MKKLIINNKVTDYDIDTQGRIYSHKTNKFLTGTIYNTGYQMVRLTINGAKKGYAVHRLVAETFIPNPNNLPIVNHIDGNKLNNTIDNLEWVNQSQNRQHAIDNYLSGLALGKRKKIENINKQDWKRYKDTTYLISKTGQVYNEKTQILLKQTPNKSGYIRYSLRINNKNYSKQAHILVIETWGNKILSKGQVVNHIDGNKQNNCLSNLEVVSKKDNALHACYSMNKLVKPVIKINNDIQCEYPSIIEAARQHSVTDGAIRYALKNHTKCCGCYWVYK